VSFPPHDDELIDEHLDELSRLIDTAGADEVGRVVQRRQSPDASTYVGSGKAQEIRELAEAFDHLTDGMESIAAEGEVRASVTEAKHAANIVEVNIQTDFAARNDQFKAFVRDVLGAVEVAPKGADAHTLPLAGKTIAELATELTAKIGEKIHVRRWSRVEIGQGKHGLAHAYVHLGGKIGVILTLETGTEDAAKSPAVAELADDLAMHIAATGPVSLRRDEITEDQRAKQKTIFEAQLAEDPKQKDHPERWGKIIEGKFNKWYSESVLLEQESVVTKTNANGDVFVPQVPPPACAGPLHTVDVLGDGTTDDHEAGYKETPLCS